MRVGVISDTHLTGRRALPPLILEAFTGVACILHAGDIATGEVLDELRAIAPVHAVCGNVDPPDLAAALLDALVLDLGGARIGLTHGHLGRGDTTPARASSMFAGVAGLRAVVFGHSHQPYNEMHGGILLFNPGSPTDRRRQPRHSAGLLTIEDGAIRGDILYF